MTDETKKRIEDVISGQRVLLFMKGNKLLPMCGFSATIVQILEHFKVEYGTFDVLEDPDVRQGIKEFSNWPTVPQLYVNGEFVGGCDIIREMFQRGELPALFESVAPGA